MCAKAAISPCRSSLTGSRHALLVSVLVVCCLTLLCVFAQTKFESDVSMISSGVCHLSAMVAAGQRRAPLQSTVSSVIILQSQEH